jgi:hypothetical protein
MLNDDDDEYDTGRLIRLWVGRALMLGATWDPMMTILGYVYNNFWHMLASY